MRSKELKKMFAALSDLNNSFTHYFFVWEQFSVDYEGIVKANKDKMTSEIFKKNAFAQKHNIELAKLEGEHDKTHQTLLNGIFTLIHSEFEEYLKDVYFTAKKVNPNLPELNQGNYTDDDTVLKNVLNRLQINSTHFSSEFLTTFDYLRLKRNRLVHKSSTSISRTGRELISTKGKSLNLFWDGELPKKRQGVDFSDNSNFDFLSYDILIDTLNIFRKIGNELDKKIVGCLSQQDFLSQEVLVEFKKDREIKNFSLEDSRNRRKFSGFCRTIYNFTPQAEQLNNMV